MDAMKIINRSEMKLLLAGGSCSVEITCPNGMTLGCDSSTHCHAEGDGTHAGYINCGVGAVQAGCWQHVVPE